MHKLFSCPPVQNQYVPPVFSPFRRSLTRFLLIAGCLVMLAFSSTLPALAQSRTSHAGAGDTVGNNAEEDLDDLDAVLEYMQDLYLLGLIDGEPLDDEHPLNPRYGPLREQPVGCGQTRRFGRLRLEHGPGLHEVLKGIGGGPVHNPLHSLPRGSACERCSHNEPKPERGPQGFINLGPLTQLTDADIKKLLNAWKRYNVGLPSVRLEDFLDSSCMNTRHIITEICDPTKPCRYEYDPFDDTTGEVVP